MSKNTFPAVIAIIAFSLLLADTLVGGIVLNLLPGVHAPNLLASFAESFVLSLGMVLAIGLAGCLFLTVPAVQKAVGGRALNDLQPLRFLSIVSVVAGVVTAQTCHVAGVEVNGIGGVLLVSLVLFALQYATVYGLTRTIR